MGLMYRGSRPYIPTGIYPRGHFFWKFCKFHGHISPSKTSRILSFGFMFTVGSILNGIISCIYDRILTRTVCKRCFSYQRRTIVKKGDKSRLKCIFHCNYPCHGHISLFWKFWKFCWFHGHISRDIWSWPSVLDRATVNFCYRHVVQKQRPNN